MTTAIYAFSGDPITFGHLNIIQRASRVFDKVIVAIGQNPDKKYTFNLAEREEMARKCFSNCAGMPHPHIKVVSFSGLLTDFAYEQGASVVIKGVRNSADFDYENVLDAVGKSQKLGIDTHILFADPELAHVSSSTVKAIAKHSGDIHEYVPLHVKQAVEERICGQYIIGVTGEIGCGKSYIGKFLSEQPGGVPTHNIELDHLGHGILETLTEPIYVKVRQQIGELVPTALEPDGFINRAVLGAVVFNDSRKLGRLNEIMDKPIMVRLRKEISGKRGIILINCALLSESHMLHICNNNIILIDVDKDTQQKRLLDRGLTEEQIQTRLGCQYDYQNKKGRIKVIIDRDRHGKMWFIDNSHNIIESDLVKRFKDIRGDLGVWT